MPDWCCRHSLEWLKRRRALLARARQRGDRVVSIAGRLKPRTDDEYADNRI